MCGGGCMETQTKKLKKGKKKINIFHVLLILSLCTLVFLVCTVTSQQKIIERETEGVARLDTINSTLQRVAKLELEGAEDEVIMQDLDMLIENMAISNEESLYFVENHKYMHLLQEYEVEYISFMDAVFRYRIDENRNELFEASEHHYTISSTITKELTGHIADLSATVRMYTNILIANAILVGLLMIKIFMSTHSELKVNRELSKEMFIDTSTGVFNRAKCQEILRSGVTRENLKERAIIIFDLNDLKKTNDNLGHRAGDELISSFAVQLKKATRVSTEEIFIGRYGGDEFMGYLGSVEENDVKRYLEEVEILLQEFNETQGKPFQLSCAAGYSITSTETRSRTMRELFDEADARMYQNKIAMKKRKKEELERQGIVVEEVADSRL